MISFLLSFAGAVASANPGLLKALNQMETDEERMLFVSQLHKVDFIKWMRTGFFLKASCS